jgi:hypothetical protein
MTRESERDELLRGEEAFAAMFEFLHAYWSRFKTATLADVLSDLELASDGESRDPAAWHDWLRAVDAVRERNGAPRAPTDSS